MEAVKGKEGTDHERRSQIREGRKSGSIEEGKKNRGKSEGERNLNAGGGQGGFFILCLRLHLKLFVQLLWLLLSS